MALGEHAQTIPRKGSRVAICTQLEIGSLEYLGKKWSEPSVMKGILVAKAGLTTGIIGTALGLFNNGGLGGLFGGAAPALAPFAGARGGFQQAEIAGLAVAVQKDKEIDALRDQLVEARLLRYIDDRMCGTVKGHTYINPHQLADPYMGQRQVISTHPPVAPAPGPGWDTWY